MKFLTPYFPRYPFHIFPSLSGDLAHCLIAGGASAEIVGAILIAFISLIGQV